MIEIKNYQEFLSIIHNNDDKYIFIDFYAIWCKPCMKAGPVIEQIESGLKINTIIFYKVNIDEICECVDECGVEIYYYLLLLFIIYYLLFIIIL